MKNLLLIFISCFLLLQESDGFAQNITYDNTLRNELFDKSDTLKDSIWIKSNQPYYFNVPINSNCYVSEGYCNQDTLLFCECEKRHDTIYVQISTPSACCYHHLGILIINGRFESWLSCSYDISPDIASFKPTKEVLILKNQSIDIGSLLQGYILFEGKGKAYETDILRKHKPIIKKRFNTTSNVSGYFKCTIK